MLQSKMNLGLVQSRSYFDIRLTYDCQKKMFLQIITKLTV